MNVRLNKPRIRGLLPLDSEAYEEGFIEDFLSIVGFLADLKVGENRAQNSRPLALSLPVMKPLHR